MKTEDERQIIRQNNEIEMLPIAFDFKQRYGEEAQQLLLIKKNINKYFIECPEYMINQEPQLRPRNDDDDEEIDGYDINEHMFLVIRSLKNG